MTNTQFDAIIGGRAGFRKMLDRTAQEMVDDGLAKVQGAGWADFSDERLAFYLIKVLIDVTIDQEDRLEIAGKVIKNVDKSLKEIFRLQAKGTPKAEADEDSERMLKEIEEETEELRQLAIAA